MGLLAQQAEPGGIEMERREGQQQGHHDPGAADAERTEAHLGVELALEFGRFGVVNLQTQTIPRMDVDGAKAPTPARPLLYETFLLVEFLGSGMQWNSEPGQRRLELDGLALGMSR